MEKEGKGETRTFAFLQFINHRETTFTFCFNRQEGGNVVSCFFKTMLNRTLVCDVIKNLPTGIRNPLGVLAIWAPVCIQVP